MVSLCRKPPDAYVCFLPVDGMQIRQKVIQNLKHVHPVNPSGPLDQGQGKLLSNISLEEVGAGKSHEGRVETVAIKGRWDSRLMDK